MCTTSILMRRLVPSVCVCARNESRRFLCKFSSSSTPSIKAKENDLKEHILSALVVNRPGTLAQIATVFGYADQNITGLCVRSTVVPELSRVTISCFLRDRELPPLTKRLHALVAVTFFHWTKIDTCLANQNLVFRSQLLLQIQRDPYRQAQLVEILEEFQAQVVVPDDEQDAANDEPLTEEEGQLNKDRIPYSVSTAASATQFLALTDEPNKLIRFVAALTEARVQIIETQTCGPVFLDAAHATLDPERATSFRRKVVAEIDKLLVVAAKKMETRCATTIKKKENRHRDSGEGVASVLQQVEKKTHDQGVRSSEADSWDADVTTFLPPTSTFQLHTNDNGCYTLHRLQLHARIAQQLYSSAPQDLSTPTFVLLVGIPGSGKSTMLGHLDLMGQLTLQDFVNFDVDDVIALLPEFYHAMLNVGLGNDPESRSVTNLEHAGVSSKPHVKLLPRPQTRYQLCRDEARFILKKNLYGAIMSRKNIILHGSGKSFTSYARIIDQVKAAGFDVHVVCLDIPKTEAYKRVDKRSSGYGRDVPRPVIDTASSLVTRNFLRLANRVPNAHLFDSIGIPPRLVWSKQRSEIVTEHPGDDVQRKYGIE